MTTETALTKTEYAPMVVEPPPSMLPTTDEMKVMVTIANSVYKTSGKLIPAEIKTSEEAFAIMLAGRELGIPPMAAFRELFIVKGRTMPSARVLMGLVLNGDPRAKFHWFERSATRAHVRLTRGNGMAIEVEYTIADAKRAGLDGNEVWRKFPADMLAYKAVTRACRLGGADLITGIGMSARGAPAVMSAIEDDGADDDPIPALDATVIEAPRVDSSEDNAEQRREAQHAVATPEEAAAERQQREMALLPVARELMTKLSKQYHANNIKQLVDAWGVDKFTTAGKPSLSTFDEAELERAIVAMRHMERTGNVPTTAEIDAACDALHQPQQGALDA